MSAILTILSVFGNGGLAIAGLPSPKPAPEKVKTALQGEISGLMAELVGKVQEFLDQAATPQGLHRFEKDLSALGRDMLRRILQWTLNELERTKAMPCPKYMEFEGARRTRSTGKTRQGVLSLFGSINLWRYGYRTSIKGHDGSVFPLARALGLVHGATPGLAESLTRALAEGGMTQRRSLERIDAECGVGCGIKRLRQIAKAVSESMGEVRHEVQVTKVLGWLDAASKTTGSHKPVIAVGRDGVSLGMRILKGRLFEMASTGTVTVYNRKGKRMGTVYLAHIPEVNQPTMGTDLTRLLNDILKGWKGPLPRLCYVTDAGDNETNYYNRVLKRMRHPKTGEKLDWVRVLDFYHASTRIWTMSDQLFGQGRKGTVWARKMLKWLKKPGGINRVLRSAVAMRDDRLGKSKDKEFKKAYLYLRNRMRFMNYAEYKKRGIPQGSGITEAACKTIVTQRLKLSGMSWKPQGAQTIMNLRVILLSGVWDEAYQLILKRSAITIVGGQGTLPEKTVQIAA